MISQHISLLLSGNRLLFFVFVKVYSEEGGHIAPHSVQEKEEMTCCQKYMQLSVGQMNKSLSEESFAWTCWGAPAHCSISEEVLHPDGSDQNR